MAIVSFLVTSVSLGAINTSASKSVDHKFPLSSVLSYPVLQGCGVTEDGGADSFVSQFVDTTGTQNVSFIALFRNDCTKVTFMLKVKNANARALCITAFSDTKWP